jgi:hypothetical protein
MRQLNQTWNENINSRLGASFHLVLDGKSDTTDEQTEKVTTLTTTKVPWKYYELKNMDFSEATGRTLLEAFNEKCGISCESIHFSNCKIQMSDFIQVVASAVNLQELRVSECPSIYTSGSQILQV